MKVIFKFIIQIFISQLFLNCSSFTVKKVSIQKQLIYPGDYEVDFNIDNRDRYVEIHFPEKSQFFLRRPLVIFLHGGGGGKVSHVKKTTGLDKIADREGFILAFPYGTGKFSKRFLTWNAGNCCGYARKNKIDDVKFINRFIEYSIEKLNVDENKIYVTGISNGGMMSHQLACTIPEKIAAIASVVGALNHTETTCKPQSPISVLSIRGKLDKHVKLDGGPSDGIDKGRVDKSATHSLNFWKKANSCKNPVTIHKKPFIIQKSYTECKDNTEVTLYILERGTHSWPGGKRGAFFLDKPTGDLNASEKIWDFFKNHPKN